MFTIHHTIQVLHKQDKVSSINIEFAADGLEHGAQCNTQQQKKKSSLHATSDSSNFG